MLGIVVVVLTRVRLGAKDSQGRRRSSGLVLTLHTLAGTVAVLTWFPYLLGATLLIGFVGLVAWWITGVAGLGLLMRWMPARGKHANTDDEDDWASGPGLSILAHVGLALGVVGVTYAYATGAV